MDRQAPKPDERQYMHASSSASLSGSEREWTQHQIDLRIILIQLGCRRRRWPSGEAVINAAGRMMQEGELELDYHDRVSSLSLNSYPVCFRKVCSPLVRPRR